MSSCHLGGSTRLFSNIHSGFRWLLLAQGAFRNLSEYCWTNQGVTIMFSASPLFALYAYQNTYKLYMFSWSYPMTIDTDWHYDNVFIVLHTLTYIVCFCGTKTNTLYMYIQLGNSSVTESQFAPKKHIIFVLPKNMDVLGY